MLSTIISLITSKARLYIEYTIIAAVLALGCVALSFYWKTKVLEATTAKLQGDVSTLNNTVRQASADNAAQQKAINDLVTQRAQDAFAMQALSDRFNAIEQTNTQTRSKLNALVKNNAQVRDHRSIVLPTDLQRLYNDPADTTPNTNPSGQGNTPGNAPTAVPIPQSAAAGYSWRHGRRLASVENGCATLCGPHGCGYRLVQT